MLRQPRFKLVYKGPLWTSTRGVIGLHETKDGELQCVKPEDPEIVSIESARITGDKEPGPFGVMVFLHIEVIIEATNEAEARRFEPSGDMVNAILSLFPFDHIYHEFNDPDGEVVFLECLDPPSIIAPHVGNLEARLLEIKNLKRGVEDLVGALEVICDQGYVKGAVLESARNLVATNRKLLQ